MTGKNTRRFFGGTRIALCTFLVGLLISAGSTAGSPERGIVLTLPDFQPVDGHAALVRTPNSVHLNIWTTDLDASAVYTVWWVLLPSETGEGDFCVMWATGHPIGPNGTGNFAANLHEGEPWTLAEPSPDNGGAGPCGGLVNAETQPVLAVLRTHGPKIPTIVYEQMSTYLGGCADDENDPNFCIDQQIIIF